MFNCKILVFSKTQIINICLVNDVWKNQDFFRIWKKKIVKQVYLFIENVYT